MLSDFPLPWITNATLFRPSTANQIKRKGLKWLKGTTCLLLDVCICCVYSQDTRQNKAYVQPPTRSFSAQRRTHKSGLWLCFMLQTWTSLTTWKAHPYISDAAHYLRPDRNLTPTFASYYAIARKNNDSVHLCLHENHQEYTVQGKWDRYQNFFTRNKEREEGRQIEPNRISNLSQACSLCPRCHCASADTYCHAFCPMLHVRMHVFRSVMS